MHATQTHSFRFPVVTEIVVSASAATPPRTQREIVLASLLARP